MTMTKIPWKIDLAFNHHEENKTVNPKRKLLHLYVYAKVSHGGKEVKLI